MIKIGCKIQGMGTGHGILDKRYQEKQSGMKNASNSQWNRSFNHLSQQKWVKAKDNNTS